jgi:hypothetical protein
MVAATASQPEGKSNANPADAAFAGIFRPRSA